MDVETSGRERGLEYGRKDIVVVEEEASKSGWLYLAVTTPLGGQCEAASISQVHSSPWMLDKAL